MKLVMNLKSNFKLVPEGERRLKITKAEAKPSGKPTHIDVTFQDSEGGFINSNYDFVRAIYPLSVLFCTALGLDDGDEIDPKEDASKIVGKELICEVVHREGSKPNDEGKLPIFANIKQIIRLADDESASVEESPRNSITSAISGLD